MCMVLAVRKLVTVKDMKILITGAAGFIGSHLGNELTALGHDVIGIDDFSHPSDRPRVFDCEYGEIWNGTVLSAFDVIFHLAAHINVDESINKPSEYLRNNSLNTVRLLKGCQERGFKGKFIYASSAEVYGPAQTEAISEQHVLNPMSPYAVSKLAAEQMCKLYREIHGMDVTIIRNFNTFGEYQRNGVYGGVIAKFARMGKEGQNLTVYGSGEQTRDYMHVSQAVNGYILAMEKELPMIVNFGSGTEVKIIDIARVIADKFNVGIEHKESRPGDLMRLRADVSKAKEFGYKVTTTFWEDLDKYLEHVKAS